ncbi:hypothetical protein N9L68_00230 [bacterium]|nr:hypothetical protein [bacterium]
MSGSERNYSTTYCAKSPASDGGVVRHPAFTLAPGGEVNNWNIVRNLIISLQDQLMKGEAGDIASLKKS